MKWRTDNVFENGKWKMENGIENGIENGKWRMENGEWN